MINKKRLSKTNNFILYLSIFIILFSIIVSKGWYRGKRVVSDLNQNNISPISITNEESDSQIPEIEYDKEIRFYTSPILYNSNQDNSFRQYQYSLKVPSDWDVTSMDPRSTVELFDEQYRVIFTIAPAAIECNYDDSEAFDVLVMDNFSEHKLLDGMVRVSRQKGTEYLDEERFTVCGSTNGAYNSFAFTDQYISIRAPKGTLSDDLPQEIYSILESLEISIVDEP